MKDATDGMPWWVKLSFFIFVALCLVLATMSMHGCSCQDEDDSLDKISEKVLDENKGIEIQIKPIPKEKAH